MAQLSDIVSFLDELLETDKVPEKYGTNGLQVEGPEDVRSVGFCVDACLETFDLLQDCQLIVVHHGLFWPSLNRITGPAYRALRRLLQNGTALYASHLPLDVHAEVGNNAQLIQALGMTRNELFPPVGWIGETTLDRDELHARVEEVIGPARMLPFGPSEVLRVAVSSGQANVGMVGQAVDQKAQVLLTGEAGHPIYHAAQEAGLTVMLAGHYATEVWGVKALMPLVEQKFQVTTRFVNVATGF